MQSIFQKNSKYFSTFVKYLFNIGKVFFNNCKVFFQHLQSILFQNLLLSLMFFHWAFIVSRFNAKYSLDLFQNKENRGNIYFLIIFQNREAEIKLVPKVN